MKVACCTGEALKVEPAPVWRMPVRETSRMAVVVQVRIHENVSDSETTQLPSGTVRAWFDDWRFDIATWMVCRAAGDRLFVAGLQLVAHCIIPCSLAQGSLDGLSAAFSRLERSRSNISTADRDRSGNRMNVISWQNNTGEHQQWPAVEYGKVYKVPAVQ